MTEEDYEKLNKFVIEMFNDQRIDDEVKKEYADKYNKLKIHKVN